MEDLPPLAPQQPPTVIWNTYGFVDMLTGKKEKCTPGKWKQHRERAIKIKEEESPENLCRHYGFGYG